VPVVRRVADRLRGDAGAGRCLSQPDRRLRPAVVDLSRYVGAQPNPNREVHDMTDEERELLIAVAKALVGLRGGVMDGVLYFDYNTLEPVRVALERLTGKRP
jgi:hypothetical protein